MLFTITSWNRIRLQMLKPKITWQLAMRICDGCENSLKRFIFYFLTLKVYHVILFLINFWTYYKFLFTEYIFHSVVNAQIYWGEDLKNIYTFIYLNYSQISVFFFSSFFWTHDRCWMTVPAAETGADRAVKHWHWLIDSTAADRDVEKIISRNKTIKRLIETLRVSEAAKHPLHS